MAVNLLDVKNPNYMDLNMGSLLINLTTNSTDSSTGSLKIKGGASITKDLFVGGTIYGNISGSVTTDSLHLSDTTESTSTDTGALTVAGGTGIAKNLYVGGNANITGTLTVPNIVYEQSEVIGSTVNSTSISTGSSIIAGGCGIAKNLYVGGTINSTGTTNKLNLTYSGSNTVSISSDSNGYARFGSTGIGYMNFQTIINDTIESTSSSTGSLRILGGAGIVKDLYVGGTIHGNIIGTITTNSLHLSDTTQSTSPSSGTLICDGGLGVAKNINIGGIATITNTSPQLSLNFDPTNYATNAVNAFGDLTLATSGTNIFISSTNSLVCSSTTDCLSLGTGSIMTLGGISCTKNLIVGSTIASSGISTGALICSGGIGVAKESYFGAGLHTAGGIASGNSISATSSGTQLFLINSDAGNVASMYTTPGGGLRIDPKAGTNVEISSTIESTSYASGALLVDGGLGVARNLNVYGSIKGLNSLDVTAPTTQIIARYDASHYFYIDCDSAGGTDIGSLPAGSGTVNVTSGTQFNITSTTQSTSSLTGALTVSGGVGIAKDLIIGGSIAKGSGSFLINHPDPSKPPGWKLRHCFNESPTRGENLYRFVATTTNLTAKIPLPSYYKFLNENTQVWVSGKGAFAYGYGDIDEVEENIDIITSAEGTFNVLVLGTRKDKVARDWFDAKGVEYYEEPPKNN